MCGSPSNRVRCSGASAADSGSYGSLVSIPRHLVDYYTLSATSPITSRGPICCASRRYLTVPTKYIIGRPAFSVEAVYGLGTDDPKIARRSPRPIEQERTDALGDRSRQHFLSDPETGPQWLRTLFLLLFLLSDFRFPKASSFLNRS